MKKLQTAVLTQHLLKFFTIGDIEVTLLLVGLINNPESKSSYCYILINIYLYYVCMSRLLIVQ